MADKAVVGLVRTTGQAEAIVSRLNAAGFPYDDISVLFPDEASTRDFAHEHETKAPEGATAGGITGGAIGGTLGLLAGIGALAIPGVGPLIAAGPVMAALSGAAAGGAVGGLVGGLVGMGMPEYEATLVEGRLREGRVMIAVHTDNGDDRKRAKTILKDSGADDIDTLTEKEAK